MTDSARRTTINRWRLLPISKCASEHGAEYSRVKRWKLVTAASLLLAASVFAEVTSQNTVGYTDVAIASGKWYMLAPQFETVNGTPSDTANLLSIMTIDGVTAQTWANRSLATEIQVYNPSTLAYTHYYYTTNGGVTGWRRNPTVATELPVPYGAGVWLKVVDASEGASVKLQGQVKDTSSFTVGVGDGVTWQIISNPFPVDITQANLSTSGLTVQTWANRSSASEIQVYNPETSAYTHYYYTSGNGGTFWRRTPAAPASTDVICPVGQSVWIKAQSAGSLTFSL